LPTCRGRERERGQRLRGSVGGEPGDEGEGTHARGTHDGDDDRRDLLLDALTALAGRAVEGAVDGGDMEAGLVLLDVPAGLLLGATEGRADEGLCGWFSESALPCGRRQRRSWSGGEMRAAHLWVVALARSLLGGLGGPVCTVALLVAVHRSRAGCEEGWTRGEGHLRLELASSAADGLHRLALSLDEQQQARGYEHTALLCTAIQRLHLATAELALFGPASSLLPRSAHHLLPAGRSPPAPAPGAPSRRLRGTHLPPAAGEAAGAPAWPGCAPGVEGRELSGDEAAAGPGDAAPPRCEGGTQRPPGPVDDGRSGAGEGAAAAGAAAAGGASARGDDRGARLRRGRSPDGDDAPASLERGWSWNRGRSPDGAAALGGGAAAASR